MTLAQLHEAVCHTKVRFKTATGLNPNAVLVSELLLCDVDVPKQGLCDLLVIPFLPASGESQIAAAYVQFSE